MEKLVIPEYIAFRKLLNKIILLNLKDRRFHIIEGGGIEVIELIEKGVNKYEDILNFLISQYDPSFENKIREDVEEFIESCIKLGILINEGGEV